jgi:hypothetical protein
VNHSLEEFVMKKRLINILHPVATVIVSIAIVMVPIAVVGQAGSIPTVINYQGHLADITTGKPISDSLDIVFKLYDVPEEGLPLWTEEKTINVENGLFNVLLGSENPLTADILSGDSYMQIQVEGEEPMKPRVRLVSVAYSLRAEHALALTAADGTPEDAVTVNNDGHINIMGWADQKLQTNGYAQMGSVLIQWGTLLLDKDGVVTVDFEKEFPKACVGVFINRQIENPASSIEAYEITRQNFKINRDNDITGGFDINWFAIGY